MEADMTRETHMENEAENKEPAVLEERLHSRLSTVRPLNQETMDLALTQSGASGKKSGKNCRNSGDGKTID